MKFFFRQLVILGLILSLTTPTPAQAFTQAQINSLLGLLTAFNVPPSAITTVQSILTGISVGFNPFAPGAIITHLGHSSRTQQSQPVPEDSGTPEWLPEGAIAFADFKNGHYYANGAETTIDGVVVENADWTNFEKTDIEPGVGWGGSGSSFRGPVLAPELASSLLALSGFTARVDASVQFVEIDVTDLPNFNFDNTADVNNNSFFIVNSQQVSVGSADRKILATTLTTDKFSASYNGSPVLTDDPVSGNFSDYTDIAFQIVGSGTIASITIYPAKTDEDLPALTAIIPENAKIHIDLVHQFAWTEDDGFVPIDTLLGSDPNTESGAAASNYDPDFLTADGYTGGGPFLAAIGSLRTELLAGSTLRFQIKNLNDSDQDQNARFLLMSEDGNDALEVDLLPSDNRSYNFYSFGGSLNETVSNTLNANSLDSVNAMAITLTNDRVEVAANGGDAIAGELDETDRPSDNPMVAAAMRSGSEQAIQTITVYDPLPTTDGLSELSETGITNTAPHDLTYRDISNVLIGFEFVLDSNGATAGGTFLDTINATDNEGNPLVLSLSDTGGDKITLFNFNTQTEATSWPRDDAVTVQVAAGKTIQLEDSPVTFTLRATDPGGLYTEQEFTITVTP